MDAMDIKESLGAHHVKAPTPPMGTSKAARLAEAQAHVGEANIQIPGVTLIGPGLQVQTFKDPQYGHQVEEVRLPLQAPGLGQLPTMPPENPRVVAPTVVQRDLAKKDDPGNTAMKGNLTTEHQAVPPPPDARRARR